MAIPHLAIAVLGRGRAWPTPFSPPINLIQTPKQVWRIWERDHLSRAASSISSTSIRKWKHPGFGRIHRHYEGRESGGRHDRARRRTRITTSILPYAAKRKKLKRSFEAVHDSQDGRVLTAIVTVEDPTRS